MTMNNRIKKYSKAWKKGVKSVFNGKDAPSENEWNAIARTLVGKSLAQLKETPAGAKYAEWAESNPFAFEALLRITSIAIQQVPKNGSPVWNTVVDQLSHLPADVRKAMAGGTTPFHSPSAFRDVSLSSEKYYTRYEAAVAGSSADELGQVAKLNSGRLKEWLLSPKAIRPHLLKKWREEKPFLQELDEGVGKFLTENILPIAKKMDDGSKRLEKWVKIFFVVVSVVLLVVLAMASILYLQGS